MNFESQPQAVDILLVEDNAGDVRLTWDPLESTCRHASLSIL